MLRHHCRLGFGAAPCHLWAPSYVYPGTQGDGVYNVMGLLAEAVVLPVCSLTLLPFSSHRSKYSAMNYKNRTEKYIKILSIALVVSEALL